MSPRKFLLLLASCIISGSILAPRVAHAWDGTVTGKITNMDVTGGSNYGVRISLYGVANMCTGGPGWAYLNDADSNYKIYVAALMMAKAQNNNVVIYSNFDGSYCHIGYISVQSS